jgi:hypothetical protein
MSNAGIFTICHSSNLNTPALYEQPNGLILICAWCGKICNVFGQWVTLEDWDKAYFQARFTHGICPACSKSWFG